MRFARWWVMAAALAGTAAAQESPSEVTDAEIAKYKKAAYEGCREPGLKRGDPETRVNAFCSCMIMQLEQTMKRPDWQQAYFYFIRNESEQHNRVLAPHLPNVKHCVKP
jgi:hypothetical protein